MELITWADCLEGLVEDLSNTGSRQQLKSPPKIKKWESKLGKLYNKSEKKYYCPN